ncbi:MAG: Spy/CpxP family protein refolding chaperone [Bryobacterales bacterium]|jgi:Spy/CpxP family protein refolding chaperone|nr:Spy/CpxP family protein refolding chaperone [Bryobacterales bacterium]
MLKKRSLILGLSLALVSVLAMAQGPRGGRGVGGGPGGGGPGMGGRELMGPIMARLLDLTDAQKTAIRERMQAAGEQAKPIREQNQALRQQIQDAVQGGASDATLEQLAAESGRLSGQLQAISLKTRSYIHNQVLTVEQRQKLAELREEFRNRPRRDRMGPGNRMGPGSRGPAPAAPPASAGTPQA